MFKKIVKRDGKIVDFDQEKITDAIAKAPKNSSTTAPLNWQKK